jgi:hypothetical protein
MNTTGSDFVVLHIVIKVFTQQEEQRKGLEGGGGRNSRTRDYKNLNDSVSNAMGILGSATKLVNFIYMEILQGTPWLPHCFFFTT